MTYPPQPAVPSSQAAITPGPPTMVLSNMPAGTVLVNNDPTNSIWVSENPSVSPGYGYELGPAGGTLTWQYDGQACYACVDTGVVSTVQLLYGNTVSDLSNPVAIGAAIASVLVEEGIPTKLLTTQVTAGSTETAASTTFGPFDISEYSQLIISVLQDDVNATGPTIVSQSLDEAGVDVVDVEYVGISQSIPVRLAVAAPWLYITVGKFTVYEVVGTNRPAIVRLDTRSITSTIDEWSIGSTAMVNGTTYPLAQTNDQARMEGLVYAVFAFGASGTAKGLFLMVDQFGNSMVVANAAEAPTASSNLFVNKLMAVPAGGYSFEYLASASYTAAPYVHLVQAAL